MNNYIHAMKLAKDDQTRMEVFVRLPVSDHPMCSRLKFDPDNDNCECREFRVLWMDLYTVGDHLGFNLYAPSRKRYPEKIFSGVGTVQTINKYMGCEVYIVGLLCKDDHELASRFLANMSGGK